MTSWPPSSPTRPPRGSRRRFSYTTIAGQPYTLPLGGLMYHVVDHSAYHRGQLNTMIRQAGGDPALAYYMLYLASREAAGPETRPSPPAPSPEDPHPMPRRLAFALVVLLIPATAGALAPKPPDLPIDAYRLPNGLKVVLSRDPTVPRVVVSLAFHVGSKDERAGRTGFAHFFEHMMFRGTKNVPNYDIPLQEAGAQTNAFTSEDMTVYFETVPENYLRRALYMEAERLAFLPSALDQEKFATEREVVKNERRQSIENVPYGLASETLQAKVFPEGHPYSWSVIGSMKDLDASTTDDLKRFFGEFYHPGNATLCLVGDFDPGPTKAWIADYFGPLVAGPARKPVAAPAAPAVSLRVEQADDVQLPRVYWAWPSVADDNPDAPALDLLAQVLAGGDASRLHKALVLDSRVAADVSADSDTKEAGGLFTVDATASEGKTTADVERLLNAEFARLRKEPPTAGELARALALFEKANYAALTPAPGPRRRPGDRLRREGRSGLLPQGLRPLPGRHPGRPRPRGRAVSETREGRPGDPPRPARRGRVPRHPRRPQAPPRRCRRRRPRPRARGRARLDQPSPTPPRVRPFQPPKIHRHTLSNGLDVWVAPWKTLPIVSARILIPAGTADDPRGKSGLAHLTTCLLDQGTTDLTATQLAEAFEALGVTPAVGVDPRHHHRRPQHRDPQPARRLRPRWPDAGPPALRRGGRRPRASVAAHRPAPGARRPLLDRPTRLPQPPLRPRQSLRQPRRGARGHRQDPDAGRCPRLPSSLLLPRPAQP